MTFVKLSFDTEIGADGIRYFNSTNHYLNKILDTLFYIISCIYKYKEKGRFKNMFKKITYSTKKLIGSIFDLISSIVIALLP